MLNTVEDPEDAVAAKNANLEEQQYFNEENGEENGEEGATNSISKQREFHIDLNRLPQIYSYGSRMLTYQYEHIFKVEKEAKLHKA